MDLKLKQTGGYTVTISDEKGGDVSKRYYKDYNIASVKSKGAGYYGEDGRVVELKLWEDSDGNLYSVELLGKFSDSNEKYRMEVLSSIKNKLSKQELELLGLI